MKTLYFEGYGEHSSKTAFHTKDGTPIYLNIYGGKKAHCYNPAVYQWKLTGFVEDCHTISDKRYKNKSLMSRFYHSDGTPKSFPYTEKGILELVNKLGGDFDAVKILHGLSGYYVDLGLDDECRYGDDFKYDPELTRRRNRVKAEILRRVKAELELDLEIGGNKFHHIDGLETECYVNIWVDGGDPYKLRITKWYQDGAKRYTIRLDTGDTLDDWMATMKEWTFETT